MSFRKLPKIELHCHLDGCVRVETVRELGAALGLTLPLPLESALVAPETCENLADYIRRFALPLEVMQHREHLRRIARELVEDFSTDGIIYGEVRFAPQLHTRRGLSLQEVVDSVHDGLQEGKRKTGVRTGLILCCLRHESGEDSLKIARLAVGNRGKVCALDLAGDEARYTGEAHAEAFTIAREAGLRRTVHAGEAAGAASIVEALEVLGAERIGHGVRIEESARVVDTVRRRAIPLEVCPLSNVQTRAVDARSPHPIGRLFHAGLRVTVSTDARTVSATSVTREFERLAQDLGWGLAEFWQCQRHAAEAAFVSPELRAELHARLDAGQASRKADVASG